MARDTSRAIAGFYPCPPEVIPAIAALCKRGAGDHYSMVDPCAGDGAAAVQLSRAVFGDAWSKFSLYAIEMEASRYRKLAARASGNAPDFDTSRLRALHGDSFAAEFGYVSQRGGHQTMGASVGWYNFPYDEGKVEARWLERWTEALRPNGVLLLLVPYTALRNCADTLSRHYNVIGCFKLAEPLFSQDATRAFKQVVLYAVRRAPLLDPDPVVRARIIAWSQDAASIPVLPEAGTARPIVTIPGHPWHRSGFAVWRMRPVDTEALLARFRPFHVSDRRNELRPVPGMVPPPASELLCRNYPVATPLKPAHIATAIAAGVFNGAHIVPDDPDAGWPDMLVKGVFDREFTEIDEKVNKDGEKTASIRVQQPKLRVTVLDLREGTYHTLVDSDEESAADTVARITTADLLAIYGQSLLRVMLTNCPALHDPARDGEDVAIADLARPLYKAQAHTVRAMLKVLGADKPVAVPKRAMWKKRKRANAALFKAAVRRHYHGKAAILLGECGAGKTGCAVAATKTIALPVLERGGQWRTLVVCPPHLLKSWRDQTAAVTPEARVVYLSDIHDVDRLAADTEPGMVIAVLSREVAKLGHAYDGIANTRALLVTDSRDGFGVTAPRRARAAACKLVVRHVAPDGEVWATIEESADGERWATLATFDEMLARGEQTITVTPAKESLYTRVAWSSASDASFGVYDSAGAASTCPQCGIGTPRPEKVGADHAEELARKRIRCPRKFKVPASVLSRAAKLIAEVVYAAYPHAPEVSQLLTSRGEAMAVAKAAKRVPDIAAAPTPPDHYSDEDKADYRERARVAMDAWQRARVSPRLRYALDMVVGSRCRKRNHHLREGIDSALRFLLWAIGDDTLTCSVAVKLYKASIPMSAETYGEGADLRTTARGLLLLVGDEQMQRAAASQCMATGVLDKTTHYYSGYVAPWTRWDEDAKLLRRGGNSALHGGISCQGCEVLVDGLRVGDGAAAVHAIARLTAIGAWDKLPPCDEPLYEAVADPTRGGRRFALSKYIARRHPKLFDLLVLDECFVRGTMVSGRPIESLHVGDEVDAYDEATRTMVKRRVVRLYRSKPTALVRVHVRGMEPIVCTPNHPFLCSDGWERAGQLQAGDIVRTMTQQHGNSEVPNGLHHMRRARTVVRSDASEQVLRDVLTRGAGGAQAEVVGAVSDVRGAYDAHGQAGVAGEAQEQSELRCLSQSAQRGQGLAHGSVRVPVLHMPETNGGSSWSSCVRCAESREGVLQPRMLACVHGGGRRRDREDHGGARQGDHQEAHAGAQPDGRSGVQGQGSDVATCKRVVGAACAWWQRPWAYGSAATSRVRVGLGDGACDPDSDGARLGVSNLVQGGHRERGPQDHDRDRWQFAQQPESEGEGREEIDVPGWARVDHVEVLQRGSDGTFGGVCPDGLVYNLEVEGVHTYTANGVIVHNCHEASNSDAAQSRAMWRLAGLKMPVIAMTGTAMGGYAEQLWAAQIALDPQFGDEFSRDDKGAFIDRYGYVKVQERDVDKRTGEVVAYGSASDRVTREVKILSNAPGVLPLFLLRYLLRIAPVLHKADLKLELPPCREIPITVAMTPALAKKATHLYEDLKAQIKMDRFDRVLAGKLFGALAHLATEYPLLASADTGNAKGRYEIRYPDNRDLGIHARELVVGEDGIDASEVLPIEAKTIEIVRAELAEGRRCMVLATSAVLNPRLRRLLEEALREPVALLDAKKVDTSKREQWIIDNCVTPDVRVLVVNPEAIQTGLNPLVHFSTEVWLQNPQCRAIGYRQAVGRVDRIGQKESETRIYTLTYDFGPNQAAYALWMHKVATSMATDGLDAGGALAAAGVGGSDGRIDGFGVGRLIFEVMSGERTFKPRKHVAAAARKAATTAPKGARKARGAGTVGAPRSTT